MIETDVEVVEIEPIKEPVISSAPIQDSEVEVAKEELTVNVLRVMNVIWCKGVGWVE